MSVTANLTAGTGPTGYTCWKCGGFVPNGCAHFCQRNMAPQFWAQPNSPAPLWTPDGPQQPHEWVAHWAEQVRKVVEGEA